MVKSLQALSEAMKTCAHILEDYVSLSPENIADTNEKKRKAEQDAADAAEGNGKAGKRAKKEKKIKDPNEPKRPPSAYLAYQNAVREDLKKAQPDMPYAALMGQIAEKWKLMTAEEKQVSFENRIPPFAGGNENKKRQSSSSTPEGIRLFRTSALPRPIRSIVGRMEVEQDSICRREWDRIVASTARPTDELGRHLRPLSLIQGKAATAVSLDVLVAVR